MNRYSQIPITKTQENLKPRYSTVRYPQIPLDPSDIYVYVNQGDRYDTLASTFYGDSSLWWIINRANPAQDSNSLFPSVGAQIRIPSSNRISLIIVSYENLNR